MRDLLQCLLLWLEDEPIEQKGYYVLKALAQESLKVAQYGPDQRRFTAAQIVQAVTDLTDAGDPVGKSVREASVSPTKWLDWHRSVVPYWEQRKNRVISLARERGLGQYPKPDYVEGGGRGNENLYQLTPELLSNDAETTSKPDGVFEQATAVNSNDQIGTISYEVTKPGEIKPSLRAKLLFQDGQVRIGSWQSLLIRGYVLAGMLTAVFLPILSYFGLMSPRAVTTQHLTILVGAIGIPIAIWFFVIRPWIRLLDDRIIPAPDSALAFSEKNGQLELLKKGDTYLIRLVRYSGTCFCGAAVYLDDGSPDFPRRMVGRCSESPREHIFSFDRVTRMGRVLRGP